MVTTAFAVKVNRIRNRKDKDYFIYRVNIPHSVAKELDLKDDDYLLLNAKKAEWYHLLDWSTMEDTWARLPDNIKGEIITAGLPHPISQPKRSTGRKHQHIAQGAQDNP